MKFLLCFSLLLVAVAHSSEGVHLFILSGQSNMAGHRPEEAFVPAVEKRFGKENVVVVQDAHGGQPIQRWYRGWKSPEGDAPAKTADLYDRLMSKVKPAIKDKELISVTFLWMQGEKDARMEWGSVYKTALLGLHRQVSDDLGAENVNLVIGRLSDFDMDNRVYPDWTRIREIQVEIAESSPRFAWVDTDDLNDGKNRKGKEISNDLHYSAEGYKTFGKRLAAKAITLIEANR